ncbi:MAG: flagellar motor protein MotB [Pseudomonadota bacterium]
MENTHFSTSQEENSENNAAIELTTERSLVMRSPALYSDYKIKTPGAAELYDQMGEGWSVPWSDLMMVMFVMFAVLYILEISQPKVELEYQPQPVVEYRDVPAPIESPVSVPAQGKVKGGNGLDLTNNFTINVFEQSSEAVKQADLDDVKVAVLSDQSVKVSVEGPLLFELGKADLRDELREFLDSLAVVIRQTPFQVRVIGHTDDKPINTNFFPSNWELSLVRASTVARYLIESGDLDPTRFTVMGRGQYEPVADNDEDITRALNRRVEIIITREDNDKQAIEQAQTPEIALVETPNEESL